MTAQERDEGAVLSPGDLVSTEYVVDAVAQRGPGWISYRGHHVERTDELVAITSLRADAPSAGYIEAFARRSRWLEEARMPNVPPLLASGVEMGLPFIVTPWVDGLTLRELLAEEGSLPRDEALRIIKSVGESLDAMHARRPVVVHQLLSLSNIRVDAMTRAARVMDAGVAHALRLARVDDVHSAAKIEGVFRAPEDTLGRPPSPAIDRYALAKLAEVLLAPIPAGSTLARVISRGSSDLSASRFSTCASFVQSLGLALKETRPAETSAPASATASPSAASVASATKSPSPQSIANATSSPAASAISAATKSPTAAAIGAATRSPAASVIAASTVTESASKSAGPAIAPPSAASPEVAAPAPVVPPLSPPAAAGAPAVTPPLPTPAKPMAPPLPRAAKNTLMGVAPPPLPPSSAGPAKKSMTSTLVGIAPLLPELAPPEPVAAPVGVAPSEPTKDEESHFPFASSPSRTSVTEDSAIAVSDQSIMEVLPDNLGDEGPALEINASDSGHFAAAPSEPVAEPAPQEPPAPLVPKPIAAVPASAKEDLGLAKTMLSSAPLDAGAARPAAKPADAPLAAVDDAFPAIPPLADHEREKLSTDGADVPPLFDLPPPVPSPINPDATSGVAPIDLEKARKKRSFAIAAAVVLGLGGGVGGGVVLFKQVMGGDAPSIARGIDANSTAADAGAPIVEPPAAEDAAVAQPAVEDASAVIATAEDSAVEDASALVANATADGSAEDSSAVAQSGAPEDSGVLVQNAGREDSGAPSSQSASAPPTPGGIIVVDGTAGLSGPDWRIRGGARRLVRERVEACGQGQDHGTARFNVRYEGATGRVIQFALVGAHYRDTPIGACVEQAMRSIALPPFTDPHWDTDYAVPLR